LFILIIAIAVAAVFLLFNSGKLPGIGNADRTQVIKIGYSQYPYPPLHYYIGDELTGFDIELAQKAADIMRVKIEFVPIDWQKNTDTLVSGEVDMLWGGLERASLDENLAAFTKPYLRSDIILLMNEDRNYEKFEDLQGLSVCALNFTPAFHYLKVYDRDVIKSKRAFTPPDYQELMDSLSSGEFDCMITDTSFASFFRHANKSDTYRMSETLIGSNYAVAVRAGDTELLNRLQAALDELESDGSIEALKEKWIAD